MTKLQTAWLVFYYFLFVRIQEVIRQNRSVCVFSFFSVLYYCYYLVNFALFWRFATLERYYAEKWWCIFALFHEDDCKSNKSQSVKGTYSSILCFSLQYLKIHYVTALTCTMLCSQLPFFFFKVKLIKSLAFNHRKGSNSHPKSNQCHHLSSLMPVVSRFTLIGWFWRLQ